MKYIFQDLVEYMVYQSASGCRSEPVYSDQQLDLVLFQFDRVLAAVVYRAVQNCKLNYQISIFTDTKCS